MKSCTFDCNSDLLISSRYKANSNISCSYRFLLLRTHESDGWLAGYVDLTLAGSDLCVEGGDLIFDRSYVQA